MCSLCAHTREVRASSKLYPQTFIYQMPPPPSPIHSSPPLPASHSPAGAACSRTFVKVKCAEAGERWREMDGWGGVADVCRTARSA